MNTSFEEMHLNPLDAHRQSQRGRCYVDCFTAPHQAVECNLTHVRALSFQVRHATAVLGYVQL